MAGCRATEGKGRITRPAQYATVYAKGSRQSCRLLVMRALPNGLDQSRYGLSISKRVGGAVVRNKVKRRLREILRHAPLKPGWDVVFIARPEAASAGFASLREAVESLLSRGRLLEAACLAA